METHVQTALNQMATDYARRALTEQYSTRYGHFTGLPFAVIFDNNPGPEYREIRKDFETAVSDAGALLLGSGVVGVKDDLTDYSAAWVILRNGKTDAELLQLLLDTADWTARRQRELETDSQTELNEMAANYALRAHMQQFPKRYGYFAGLPFAVIFDNNPWQEYREIRKDFETAVSDAGALLLGSGVVGVEDYLADYSAAWVILRNGKTDAELLQLLLDTARAAGAV